MLFKRYPKHPFVISERSKTLAASKPQRAAKKDQAKAPLFADQIKADHVDLNAVLARRMEMAQQFERERRRSEAQAWIKARSEFFAAQLDVQLKISIHWSCWHSRQAPANAGNFLYVVQLYTKPYRRVYDHQWQYWIKRLNGTVTALTPAQTVFDFAS